MIEREEDEWKSGKFVNINHVNGMVSMDVNIYAWVLINTYVW